MPAILEERGPGKSRWHDKLKKIPKCDIKNFAVTHGEKHKKSARRSLLENCGHFGISIKFKSYGDFGPDATIYI